jgi:carboxypeptidase family protein
MKAGHLLGGLCLSVLAGIASIPGYGAVAHAQPAAPHATLTAHAGSIVGTVWDGNDRPVPAARLRLRNLTSGRILMTTRGDQEGQFRFTGVPSGAFLVEFVDEGGGVRAVGHTFAMAPGETVATFIRLGARVPWYHGFFTNAATAAVSSAAGLGVTAVGNGVQPTSSRF